MPAWRRRPPRRPDPHTAALASVTVADRAEIQGSLDLPADGSTVEAGEIEVAGWALNGSELPALITVAVNGTAVGAAQLGQVRDDVGGAFPNCPNAAYAGWRCPVRIASALDPVTVEALVFDSRGSVSQLGRSTIRVVPPVKRWRGQLDAPEPGGQVVDVLRVEGWCDFGGEAPAAVSVSLDGRFVERARLGMPRPDVAELLGEPGAIIAGFESILPVDGPQEGRAVAVVVTATARSGETWVVGTAEVSCAPHPAPTDEDLLLASVLRARWPCRPPTAERPRRAEVSRLLVGTHSLAIGGAQRWLTDLLGRFRSINKTDITVLSGRAGPHVDELERFGCEVVVTGDHPFDSIAGYEGRLGLLASWLATRAPYDAVLLNTVAAFPVADLAHRAGLPTVWAIHESVELPAFWHLAGRVEPYVRMRGEQALHEVTLGLFVAEATLRQYRRALGPEARLHTVGAAVDLGRFSEIRRIDQVDARSRLGLPQAPARVVLCLGTVEPRKNQNSLARAFLDGSFDQAVLAIVGDASTEAYNTALRSYVSSADKNGRVRVEPVTLDPLLWLNASDVLVSASDIESLPLVMLEAMAAGVPILATEVFGVPDLIEDGTTGWLVPPRDEAALTEGIRRALSTSASARAMIVEAARQQVVNQHDLDAYARQVWELIRKTAISTDELTSWSVSTLPGPG